MAATLSNLSLICYILSILFFVVAIILFFALQIPKTFNDYTGRSAYKRITKIRVGNEKTGNKSYRPCQVNKGRGKLTDTMPKKSQKSSDISSGTGILAENKAQEYETEATGLLSESTAELGETQYAKPYRDKKIDLTIINEIMFIHTDEVIE